MADEMLFTMAGSVATPAQMVSLEEAGLGNRADLQEWLGTNPEILGPAVKIVTFDLEGPGGSVPEEDRLSVLGLAQDGRLVVAELKWGRTSDVEVGAIKLAAQASRLLPESLAELYASFQSRHQFALSTEEALADLQAHAHDLSTESLRRPRIVLLARDFSPVLMSSVVWLSEVGLDLRLVQVSAFRSYTGGMSGAADAPMISVKQVYPLRDVEDFTISPERALAARSRRVQEAGSGCFDCPPARVRRRGGGGHDLHLVAAWRHRFGIASPTRGLAARGSRPPHRPLAEPCIGSPRLGRR